MQDRLANQLTRLAQAIERNNYLLSMGLPRFYTVDQLLDRYQVSLPQFKAMAEVAGVSIIRTGRRLRVSLDDVVRLDSQSRRNALGTPRD